MEEAPIFVTIPVISEPRGGSTQPGIGIAPELRNDVYSASYHYASYHYFTAVRVSTSTVLSTQSTTCTISST